MTTQEAIDIFKILQDKYASPHLTDGEILKFLNMAQNERLNRLVPDDMGGVTGLEQDQNVLMNIRPFIYKLNNLLISSGFLPNSIITDALDLASDEEDTTVFRVLGITYYQGLPAKFVRHNNYIKEETNAFKEASYNNQKYQIVENGYIFTPEYTTNEASMVVIKTPNKISLSSDPKWDDYNMNLILMIALQFAGVSTRDEELIMDIRNINTTK